MNSYSQIVLICTGNTCRSPMAEGLLKKELKGRNFRIISRGLMVFGEAEATRNAVVAMGEKGIDITGHRSKPFDKDEYGSKTLVLTMTEGHKELILQHGFKGDVYSIKEFVGDSGDVKDPYGGDLNVYRRCADELEAIIQLVGGKLI